MKNPRLVLEDKTTWPNANAESFGEIAWELRYDPKLSQCQQFFAAEVMSAYASLTTGTLEHAIRKIRMIKKAMKGK